MALIFTKIDSLKTQIKQWKAEGQTIGFVPTMGALHAGHESLIKRACAECDKVIVSIFVNPTQFSPNEDFDKYPRQLEADQQICEENCVDIIFVPEASEMYPEGKENITLVVPPASFQNKLCGKTRKGHFNGVATVVLKLFNIVQPDKAYFGQKDAQQLIIIKKMIRDLNLSIEIIGCPIIRDKDGLALSSRNAYLSPEEREKALTISQMLKNIESEKNIENALKLLHPDISLEYLEVLDAKTLEPVDTLGNNTLVAVAAKVGNVRLIDNILI